MKDRIDQSTRYVGILLMAFVLCSAVPGQPQLLESRHGSENSGAITSDAKGFERDYCPVHDKSLSSYLSTQVLGLFRDDFGLGDCDELIWKVRPGSEKKSHEAENTSGLLLEGSIRAAFSPTVLMQTFPVYADQGFVTLSYRIEDPSESKALFFGLAGNEPDTHSGPSPRDSIPLDDRGTVSPGGSEQTAMIIFDRLQNRLSLYRNGCFIRTIDTTIPRGFSFRLLAVSSTGPQPYRIRLLKLDSDFAHTKEPIPVRTTCEVLPGNTPEEQILHYNMDAGAKFEWFARETTPDGFMLRFFKAEGAGPDGLRHVYEVDPPALMWKWPAEKGEIWEQDFMLIIDGATGIPTHSRVEILDTDNAVVLPGGSYKNVLKLRFTYHSHLGTDVSTFHIGDGIGMLREEQITNDGRILLTEYVSADYAEALPAPVMVTSGHHADDGMKISMNLEGLPDTAVPYLMSRDFQSDRTVFWTEDGCFHDQPVPFALPSAAPPERKIFSLEFLPGTIHEDLKMLEWNAVSVEQTRPFRISHPSMALTTFGCSGNNP